MLTYYRNHMIHNFVNEAYIALAILGLSNIKNVAQGVSITSLWKRVVFLRDLLGGELIIRKQLNTEADMIASLRLMNQRGFLDYNEETQSVSLDSKNESQSYSQSFLYHLLLPLVESYWITLTFFVSQQQTNHDEETLYSKIQWIVQSMLSGGQVKFYEACMLQSIKNAVQRFFEMGILTK